MSKKARRIELSGMIFRRLDRAVEKNKIAAAIDIICDKLFEQIVNDKIVSIKNFGTFSMSLFPGHFGFDPNTRTIKEKGSSYTVKFHPHEVFLRMLNGKKSKFSKN